MILSALLTSVGINLGLCVLLFALYSVLRKQPGNINVYAPRLVADGEAADRSVAQLNIERFLPSAGWVRRAWIPSEEDLLSTVGLDAVVFLRIFVFSLRVFLIAGVIGMFVILPVNYRGDQLQDFDLFNVTNQSLEKFSISNVKDGSNWLWVHFAAAYIITFAVCCLLFLEYKHISFRRLQFFYASSPKPHHFTIVLRGSPTSNDTSLSDAVQRFFSEYHSSIYLSHSVVHRTSKLHNLMHDVKKMYKKLSHVKSTHKTIERSYGGGFLDLFGRTSDPVKQYGKKLEDLEQSLRRQQSGITSSGEEVPAAFVYFRSRYGMEAVVHVQQTINPTQWVAEQAPEPSDVYWPFFSASFTKRWISRLMVIVASTALTIIFLIPVLFVQGLANLDQLKTLFPFLKGILNIAFVSQVITGYLPSLVLHLFLMAVPPIMKLLTTMQGYISYSEIERSACGKMLLFIIWNIFFANVLSGSIAGQIMLILDPKNIPIRLAIAVPAQATFFISYVVTSGWTSLSSELTRTMSLLRNYISRVFSKSVDDDFSAPSIPYHSDIPSVLFFGLLGLTYSLLAPLMLPFLLVYFFLGYIIYRNQLLNVYLPKYETCGKFWPSVHSTMIFSLLLMQAIAIGIFALKKLPLASSLSIPLPVLTLVFNDYCRKRFLPNFQGYPAESLIKKDRDDQNNPAMNDFFNNLPSAYRDPALMPIRYSENPDSQTSPLLANQIREIVH